MLHLGVISLIPELLNGLNYGITGRAIERGLACVDFWNPRDFASGSYKQVDDRPYGGGPGMVLMFEPLHAALSAALKHMPDDTKVIYLSPQGRCVKQTDLNQVVEKQQSLLFIAGRYEGIDERIITLHVDEEWSVGDFVLSGGELAAMVFMDALIRLIPGSLGHQGSAQQDSFMDGLLDCPHYTRPASVLGMDVPSVLLEGNHRKISQWRREQILRKTFASRPDLLDQRYLSETDSELLKKIQKDKN